MHILFVGSVSHIKHLFPLGLEEQELEHDNMPEFPVVSQHPEFGLPQPSTTSGSQRPSLSQLVHPRPAAMQSAGPAGQGILVGSDIGVGSAVLGVLVGLLVGNADDGELLSSADGAGVGAFVGNKMLESSSADWAGVGAFVGLEV